MRLCVLTLTALVVAVSLCVSVSIADVPQMINYQGRLTDTDGWPVADGDYVVTFRIYDDSAIGATMFWDEEDTVITSQGLFSVILGRNDPIPDTLFGGAVTYLGIQLAGQGEIYPRTTMITVPYAYRAVHSDTADYALVADGDWVISGDDLYRLNGKVGIGTDSPELTLSVRDSSQTLQALFGQGRTSGHSAIAIGEEDALNKAFFIRYDHDNNRALMHIAGDPVSAFVTVAGGGNVGIGNANPVAKLDVAGSVHMWGFGMATGASDGHVLTSSATGVGTWQPAGNIGGSSFGYSRLHRG